MSNSKKSIEVNFYNNVTSQVLYTHPAMIELLNGVETQKGFA